MADSLKYPIPKRLETRSSSKILSFKIEELEMLGADEGTILYVMSQDMYDKLIVTGRVGK